MCNEKNSEKNRRIEFLCRRTKNKKGQDALGYRALSIELLGLCDLPSRDSNSDHVLRRQICFVRSERPCWMVHSQLVLNIVCVARSMNFLFSARVSEIIRSFFHNGAINTAFSFFITSTQGANVPRRRGRFASFLRQVRFLQCPELPL